MKLIVGIDIGNATTESTLAEVNGKEINVLSSGIVKTTGIKGTKENVKGVFASLQKAFNAAGRDMKDLSLVRINEAAPVIGDVAMETITETIITESTMIPLISFSFNCIFYPLNYLIFDASTAFPIFDSSSHFSAVI